MRVFPVAPERQRAGRAGQPPGKEAYLTFFRQLHPEAARIPPS
jgi:hypothetical protein